MAISNKKNDAPTSNAAFRKIIDTNIKSLVFCDVDLQARKKRFYEPFFPLQHLIKLNSNELISQIKAIA